MQRYFLNTNGDLHQQYQIAHKDDVHHIKNVMRQNINDQFIINFDNAVMVGEITEITDKITFHTIEQLDIQTELPVQITIASGLLKNDKYEWMIQKATELGATQFMPFISDRTIIKVDEKKMHKKIERFEKIVKEAAEQSYRQVIPNIEFVKNSKVLVDVLSTFDHVFIAYEEVAKSGETKSFVNALNSVEQGQSICIIFGPEGGLTEQEVAMFGGQTIGLGPRILRAETAPLYALSAMSYRLELN